MFFWSILLETKIFLRACCKIKIKSGKAASREETCNRRASKRKESSHEKVRSMPWKAGIRDPLPQYMERSLVGSYSVLFSSLRRHL